MKILIVLFSVCCWGSAFSQVQGLVFGLKEGKKAPIKQALVYLPSTKESVYTKEDGRFEIILPKELPTTLRFTAPGYLSDSIVLTKEDRFTGLEVVLIHEKELEEVVVSVKRDSKNFSRLKPFLLETLGEAELKKAACCNLSESFETNATVDVNVTDAVSGAKKIQLLGLDGVYTQFQMENLPFLTGSENSFGLNTVPGTWVESIQITKGTGSVTNGHESIAGLINVEMRKPRTMQRLLVNGYGSVIGRGELNVHGGQLINDKWSTGTFVHASTVQLEVDRNKDQFRDVPLSNTAAMLHRWEYQGKKFESRFGINASFDERKGGQLGAISNRYEVYTTNRHADFFAKTGFLFEKHPHSSLGILYDVKWHQLNGKYGIRPLSSEELRGQITALFDGRIHSPAHKYKVGASSYFQGVKQSMGQLDERQTLVSSIFGEYTYTGIRSILVVGARQDVVSGFSPQFSPRVHYKLSLDEYTDLRLTAGRAWRLPLLISDYYYLLATGKAWKLPHHQGQETAINAGASIVRTFKLWQRNSSFVIDVFHTRFDNQLIVDREQALDTFVFAYQKKQAFSNVLQAEFSVMPYKTVTWRFAYKLLDVKAIYNGKLQQQTMTPRHRFFTNVAFESRNKKWLWDATLSVYGKVRMHMAYDSQGNHYPHISQVFPNVLSQITYRGKHMEWYLGGENLLNYTQSDPIVDVANPFSTQFDATRVWAPILGTVVYGGFRYEIKRKK